MEGEKDKVLERAYGEQRKRRNTIGGVRWWGGRWMKDERRSERREAGLFSGGRGGGTHVTVTTSKHGCLERCVCVREREERRAWQ